MSTGFFLHPAISPGPHQFGCSADRKRVLITGATEQISFAADELEQVVHVHGRDLFVPDRLMLVLRTGLQIPSRTEKTPFVTLYYKLDTLGVTDEQRRMIESMREGPPPAKRAKGLDGVRVAKQNANVMLETPELDIDMRCKLDAVEKAVTKYVEALRVFAPDARFSNLVLNDVEGVGIEVIPPSHVVETCDMLTLFQTEERDTLVLTSTHGLNRYNLIVRAADVEFVLVVGAANHDDFEDQRQDTLLAAVTNLDSDAEEETAHDTGDGVDEYSFVLLCRDGNRVHSSRIFVPTGLQLVQVIEFLRENGVSYAAVEATAAQLSDILQTEDGLRELCAERPQEFACDDDGLISGGPLHGTVPFEPTGGGDDADIEDSGSEDYVETAEYSSDDDDDEEHAEALSAARTIARAHGCADKLAAADTSTPEALAAALAELGIAAFVANLLADESSSE